MRFRSLGRTALAFAAIAALGQTSDASLTFEVATVKAAAPPTPDGKRLIRFGVQGGPGTDDPGQISYSNMALRNLLMQAFGVKPFQIQAPDWVDAERFDIVAKVPPGATKDDLKVMLQNLLKERFGLAFHRDRKEHSVYALVIGKNGPKLQESQDQSDPQAERANLAPGANAPTGAPAESPLPPPLPSQPKIGKDGMPEFPPGLRRPGIIMMALMAPSGMRVKLNAERQTMAQLADSLSNQVDRPVVDMTGLIKRYDFTLDFAPDPSTMMGRMGPLGPPPGPSPAGGAIGRGEPGRDAGPGLNAPTTDAPTVFAALQDQLGLKLESRKAPMDLVVIDHLEKTPTEN